MTTVMFSEWNDAERKRQNNRNEEKKNDREKINFLQHATPPKKVKKIVVCQ